jgi:filamentous hemagglutinin family protein
MGTGNLHRRANLALTPLASALAAISLGVPLASLAGTLPTGGTFVAGAGSINAGGTSLTIDQTTTRGVIDWSHFSIGSGNRVSFLNGSGATLNRVTGSDLSVILGTLSATGSVYLINPQGIVVGPGGKVATGGSFVASTLDTCNCAFMKGLSPTFKGDSNGAVVNLGSIGSSGGDVFLIARTRVVNAGRLHAPNGVAGLAVGSDVLLSDTASGQPIFVQTGSGGTIVNAGTIHAAQASLQAADGNIFALAGKHTTIRATGTATRDGHVWLVADGGTVALDGTIEARNADGSGGTVDVDARSVALGNAFGDTPRVKAKQWNITTPAFTIDSTTARSLERSLNAGTSIGVTTTGAQGAAGDIDVASSVLWGGGAALTLDAYRSLTIEAGTLLANSGAGTLTLRADANALDNGGSVTNHGTIDWSKSLGTASAFYDMNGTYTAGTQIGNAAWAPAPMSGLRTQLTGYALVNSYSDLQNVATNLSGNYALGKDIDASASSDRNYVPLGNVDAPFSGQFDGLGHQINNIQLYQTVAGDHGEQGMVLQTQGLFGFIGPNGAVRNIGVNGSGNAGFYGQYAMYGLLAGINEGTIVRADTSGAISVISGFAYASTVGGLVGQNRGTIERSSSSVFIDSEGDNGGLVGDNAAGATITQSFATGSVDSEAHSRGGGGLAGSNEGTITQSYATGNVTFNPDYCGPNSGQACIPGAAGLVGFNSGTITQSFATGHLVEPNPLNNPTLLPAIGITTSNTGTIGNDVYWDKDTTGANIGVYTGTPVPAANGLTAAQMSEPSSFAGYDFGPNGAWAMPAGASHPVLRWQTGQ